MNLCCGLARAGGGTNVPLEVDVSTDDSRTKAHDERRQKTKSFGMTVV